MTPWFERLRHKTQLNTDLTDIYRRFRRYVGLLPVDKLGLIEGKLNWGSWGKSLATKYMCKPDHFISKKTLVTVNKYSIVEPIPVVHWELTLLEMTALWCLYSNATTSIVECRRISKPDDQVCIRITER